MNPRERPEIFRILNDIERVKDRAWDLARLSGSLDADRAWMHLDDAAYLLKRAAEKAGGGGS